MYESGVRELRQLTEEQRQTFTRTIEDETENSRLAHKVIPKYSLDPSARAVSANTLDYSTGRVDDETQLVLKERQQQFTLTRQQAEDSDYASAMVAVRFATQRLARDHDDQIFRVAIREPINQANEDGVAGGTQPFNLIEFVERVGDSGEGMVPATANAIATLDGHGYRTGFVMVAGLNLYRLLHTRAEGAADLPIVAVRGLLEGGPVYRSGVLDPDEALIMSVVGIDRPAAVEPSAEFLRIVEEPADADREDGAAGQELSQWRIFERYLGRFKERRSAVLLRLRPAAGRTGGEGPGGEGPGGEEPGGHGGRGRRSGRASGGR